VINDSQTKHCSPTDNPEIGTIDFNEYFVTESQNRVTLVMNILSLGKI